MKIKKRLMWTVVSSLSILGLFACPNSQEPRNTKEEYKYTALTVTQSSGPKLDVQSYKKLLDNLDTSKVESILTATAELINSFKGTSSSQSDEALHLFLDYYSKSINKIKKGFIQNEDFQHVLNVTRGLDTPLLLEARDKYAASYETLQKYKACGIGFEGLDEGGCDLREDPDFVIKLASNFTSDYATFVKFYADETRASLGMDASLNIDWDDLRKKIVRFEAFAKQYKQLPEVDAQIKPMLSNMLSIYIEGMDNTPAYRLGCQTCKGEIDPELKQSYSTFIKENKNSEYYDLIQGAYNNLAKHDFKFNKDLVSFIESKGIHAFQGSDMRKYIESLEPIESR
jgi:hypothetical protein